MLVAFSTLFGLALSWALIRWVFTSDIDFKGLSPFPFDLKTIVAIFLYIAASILTHIYVSVSISDYIRYSLFMSMCLTISYIDMRTKYMHDIILIIYGLAIALLGSLSGFEAVKYSMMSVLVSAGFYTLIYFLSKLYYKREAFGQGDIFLMGICALCLSPHLAIIASFLSFYLAAAAILLAKLSGKAVGLELEIAFGPYICAASWFMLCFGDSILYKLFKFTF